MQIQPRSLKLWCFLYFMNEKFNKNAKVEKLTKNVGRGVRLIVIGLFISSGSKIVKRLRRRQYDPVIIERTLGLVLGSSTALYRLFLKHYTLTNTAVGTLWLSLFKPPQRRQGPDLCTLWLLFGTPSNLSSLPDGRSTACSIRMSLNIFLIYNTYYLLCLWIDFYDLSAWCSCWFVVCIRGFIYKFLNVSFW